MTVTRAAIGRAGLFRLGVGTASIADPLPIQVPDLCHQGGIPQCGCTDALIVGDGQSSIAPDGGVDGRVRLGPNRRFL